MHYSMLHVKQVPHYMRIVQQMHYEIFRPVWLPDDLLKVHINNPLSIRRL